MTWNKEKIYPVLAAGQMQISSKRAKGAENQSIITLIIPCSLLSSITEEISEGSRKKEANERKQGKNRMEKAAVQLELNTSARPRGFSTSEPLTFEKTSQGSHTKAGLCWMCHKELAGKHFQKRISFSSKP